MSKTRPQYLLARRGPASEALVRRLEIPPERRFGDPSAFDPDRLEPGIVILCREALEPEEILEVLLGVARGRGEWTPVLVEEAGSDEPVVRALSVDHPSTLDELSRFAEGDPEAKLLELRNVINRISRGRHDINNPLTSALAETQLLLMDAPETGEEREALETVEEQLRKIRDLVQGLTPIRHRD